MSPEEIAPGVVHSVPSDLAEVLTADGAVLGLWNDLTPLARNEWLCWVEDARRPLTRQRRIGRLLAELKEGKRRPCCWPGCRHRAKAGQKSAEIDSSMHPDIER